MIANMRRAKQQLSPEACAEILSRCRDGVLAVSGNDGFPYAVPLNYVYTDGVIYFHCAAAGHKLDAVRRDPKVSFCVVAENKILQKKFTTLYKSVIVFGKAELVSDEDEKLYAIRALAKHTCPDAFENADAEIRRDWERLCILRLTPERITGKQCREFLNKEIRPE